MEGPSVEQQLRNFIRNMRDQVVITFNITFIIPYIPTSSSIFTFFL